MKKDLFKTVVIGSMLLSGCATTKKSVLLGAGIGVGAGGVSGGLVGGQRGNTGKGILIGTAIGAATGGLISYIIDKNNRKNPSLKTVQKEDKTGVPFLTKPTVHRVWVPDQIKGRRFIKGHFEYVIKEDATWSK